MRPPLFPVFVQFATLAALISSAGNDTSARKIGGRRTSHRGKAWQRRASLFSGFDHTCIEKPRTGGRRGASPVPGGEPVTAQGNTVTDGAFVIKLCGVGFGRRSFLDWPASRLVTPFGFDIRGVAKISPMRL